MANGSYSGLSRRHRRQARAEFKACCRALLRNPNAVHYTMGPGRWDGITHKKSPHRAGLLPFWGDCSSTGTWILWRALHVLFGQADRVNGANWLAGFTGTLASHGKKVSGKPGWRKVGDAVLYGPAPTFEHVAWIFGRDTVFSHGSEGGPYLLRVHYRPDVGAFRRYI